MKVTETFFAVPVTDMARATAFYVGAFGARVSAALPIWSSLHIAGVRVGLAHVPSHVAGWMGLHFAVDELDRAAIERVGGRAGDPIEVAAGVVIVDVVDTEGNTFSVRVG